jgi:hypothetical protein
VAPVADHALRLVPLRDTADVRGRVKPGQGKASSTNPARSGTPEKLQTPITKTKGLWLSAEIRRNPTIDFLSIMKIEGCLKMNKCGHPPSPRRLRTAICLRFATARQAVRDRSAFAKATARQARVSDDFRRFPEISNQFESIPIKK